MQVKSSPSFHTRTETSDYFDYEKQEVLHIFQHCKIVLSIACDDKKVIDIYLKMIHNSKNFLSVLETIKRLAGSNNHVLLFDY